MQKQLLATLVFMFCSALTAVAAADVAPSCKCEMPGTSSVSKTPIANGAAVVVFAMGVTVVVRRARNRQR